MKYTVNLYYLKSKKEKCRFLWQEVRTDIDGSIIYPFWRVVTLILFFPFYLLRVILPKVILNWYPFRLIHALLFSFLNRSLIRFYVCIVGWIILFFICHLFCFIKGTEFIPIATRMVYYTIVGLFAVEILILHYHIVRIYGRPKDTYMPPKNRQRMRRFLPLTDGVLIPNNLWFYQHLNIEEFEWSTDISDAQAHVHGEQYSICSRSCGYYLVICVVYSAITLLIGIL